MFRPHRLTALALLFRVAETRSLCFAYMFSRSRSVVELIIIHVRSTGGTGSRCCAWFDLALHAQHPLRVPPVERTLMVISSATQWIQLIGRVQEMTFDPVRLKGILSLLRSCLSKTRSTLCGGISGETLARTGAHIVLHLTFNYQCWTFHTQRVIPSKSPIVFVAASILAARCGLLSLVVYTPTVADSPRPMSWAWR